MKSGNLNILELSGPLQACNGTALPIHLDSLIKRLAADLSRQRAGFDLYEFCSVQNGMYRKDKRANSSEFQVRIFF